MDILSCLKGIVFVRLVDDSSYNKTGDKLFELFDKFMEKIRVENVVQDSKL